MGGGLALSEVNSQEYERMVESLLEVSACGVYPGSASTCTTLLTHNLTFTPVRYLSMHMTSFSLCVAF